MDETNCWCGNPQREKCCAPILQGQPAGSPEALMRARYSAYVTGNVDFLKTSWHRRTRPNEIRLDPEQRWLGLKIKAAIPPAPNALDRGEVEFVARFKINGRGHRLHELSRFECVDGTWFYVDGDLLASTR